MEDRAAKILDQLDSDYNRDKIIETEIEDSTPPIKLKILEAVHPEEAQNQSMSVIRSVANVDGEAVQINHDKAIQCPSCDSTSHTDIWMCDSCGDYICDECGTKDQNQNTLCSNCVN